MAHGEPDGCVAWCGVPERIADIQPMKCGVLVYGHVPKTGGTTVVEELKRVANESAWSYVNLGHYSASEALAKLRTPARSPHTILQVHVAAPWLVARTRAVVQLPCRRHVKVELWL